MLGIADGGLSTPAVYAELDRLREKRNTERIGAPDGLINALRTRDPGRLGQLLANDMAAAARSLRPSLARTLRAGDELGALGGVVCGSGPTCTFLVRSADAAIRLAAALSGTGVCRTVRTAHGPVSGARLVGEGG